MTQDRHADGEPARGDPASRAADAAARDAATVRAAASEAAGERREPNGDRKAGPARGVPARTPAGRRVEPATGIDDEEELVEGPPLARRQRPPALRLARVHLRTSALSLARAELETLAGQQALDAEGILDLAEVRWRTGDLPGAGDAAASYLGGGGEDALGFVIAAEAAAATDRPAEARRLAGRALERTEASLDAIFAGIPRGLIWPHDTWAETAVRAEGTAARQTGGVAGAFPPQVPQPAQAGLWESSSAIARGAEDGARHLDAASAAVVAGDTALAAVHLAVALRLSPALAPAVVEAIGNHHEASLELVRGDALRLLGYEWDARRAYAAVAAALLGPGEVAAPAAPAVGGAGRESAIPDAASPPDATPGNPEQEERS